MSESWRAAARFSAVALGLVGLDQISKAAARVCLLPDRPVALIPGFFDLRLDFNSGAAFGILPNWAPLLIIVALAAVFAIVCLNRPNGRGSKVLSTGLALLMGGAVGNLIDRLASWIARSQSEVTDLLSFHVTVGGRTRAWPTFNLADVGIVAGAVLVLVYVYVLEKRRPDEAAP